MVNSEWVIRSKKPVNGGLGTVNFFYQSKTGNLHAKWHNFTFIF
jgi:hypothetical protein